MKLIVFIVTATIFTAATVNGRKCWGCVSPEQCTEKVCPAGQHCLYSKIDSKDKSTAKSCTPDPNICTQAAYEAVINGIDISCYTCDTDNCNSDENSPPKGTVIHEVKGGKYIKSDDPKNKIPSVNGRRCWECLPYHKCTEKVCEADEQCLYTEVENGNLKQTLKMCVPDIDVCTQASEGVIRTKTNFYCYTCDTDNCNSDENSPPVGTVIHEVKGGQYTKNTVPNNKIPSVNGRKCWDCVSPEQCTEKVCPAGEHCLYTKIDGKDKSTAKSCTPYPNICTRAAYEAVINGIDISCYTCDTDNCNSDENSPPKGTVIHEVKSGKYTKSDDLENKIPSVNGRRCWDCLPYEKCTEKVCETGDQCLYTEVENGNLKQTLKMCVPDIDVCTQASNGAIRTKTNFYCYTCDTDNCNSDETSPPKSTVVHKVKEGKYTKSDVSNNKIEPKKPRAKGLNCWECASSEQCIETVCKTGQHCLYNKTSAPIEVTTKSCTPDLNVCTKAAEKAAEIKANFYCYTCDTDKCNSDETSPPEGTVIHEVKDGVYTKSGFAPIKSELLLVALSVLFYYLY